MFQHFNCTSKQFNKCLPRSSNTSSCREPFMITPAELNSPAFGFSNYSVFFNLLTLCTAYFLLAVFLSMPSPLTECKLLQGKNCFIHMHSSHNLLLTLSVKWVEENVNYNLPVRACFWVRASSLESPSSELSLSLI